MLRSIVRRAVCDAAGRVQFSYKKPSRRSDGGLIFPTMRGPRIRVSTKKDTSGSMSPADLSAALSEIHEVLKSAGVNGDRVTVFTCDAETRRVPSGLADAEAIVLTGEGHRHARRDRRRRGHPARSQRALCITDGYALAGQATKARLVCVIVGDDERAAADTPDWALTVTVPSGAGKPNGPKPVGGPRYAIGVARPTQATPHIRPDPRI